MIKEPETSNQLNVCAWKEKCRIMLQVRTCANTGVWIYIIYSETMRSWSHICLGYPCTAAVNCQEVSKEKEAEEGEKGGTWWQIVGPDLCVFILTS